ncbi:hypothetical protein K2173_019188 [Erythroxylum novogranatense]|uniref:F-box domain-containing protein n=1 Tax=Erythroxylum novogranatense TaxID=1862640 RepID=A0AAV8STM6_9ROSI|nr:hypothetical protein K2173_019188 [Erythroxylum novogranatense]
MPEIPQLPPEIIAEILSRLPVKSIMRCKCVCKPWRSFLSDHDFAKMHLEKARQSRRFFLFTEPFQSFDLEAQSYEDIRTTELNIPMSINSVDVETVGSCDGLICAAVEDERYFLVWNPTTRVVREIFMPNSSQVGHSFYGFGYDNQLDDYKIMLGSIANGSNEAELDIFTLKTNKWRRIEGLHCNSVLVGSASFLNGILHWLVVRRDNGAQICAIVSFDLVQEKFREVMQVPDQISHLTRDFKVVGKSLCLYTDMIGDYFEAWVMKEYGNPASWTTSVKFKNDALPGYENYFLLVDITTNGGEKRSCSSNNVILVVGDKGSYWIINWSFWNSVTGKWFGFFLLKSKTGMDIPFKGWSCVFDSPQVVLVDNDIVF